MYPILLFSQSHDPRRFQKPEGKPRKNPSISISCLYVHFYRLIYRSLAKFDAKQKCIMGDALGMKNKIKDRRVLKEICTCFWFLVFWYSESYPGSLGVECESRVRSVRLLYRPFSMLGWLVCKRQRQVRRSLAWSRERERERWSVRKIARFIRYVSGTGIRRRKWDGRWMSKRRN